MDSKKAVRQLKALKRYVEKNGDSKLRLAAEWSEDWKSLIATMLSAQTKDEKTIEVCEVLFEKFPSVEKLAKARVKEIEKIIRGVNYYKTKARNVKKTCEVISKEGIPESVDELTELPGVGRKTANVYLVSRRDAEAIGVDTHVARISRKLGWTERKHSEKYKIEKDLEELFPRKYWNSINWILVRFGRNFGKSRKREDEILREIG